jgi:hypothetical protein
MRSRPPRVATWVLGRFGTGQALGPVAGDLFEEWQRGRSRTWYWKQVLVAVVVGFGTEVCRHKVLAVRAVATGRLVRGALEFIWGQSLADPYWDIVRPLLSQRWWGLSILFVLPVLIPVHVQRNGKEGALIN